MACFVSRSNTGNIRAYVAKYIDNKVELSVHADGAYFSASFSESEAKELARGLVEIADKVLVKSTEAA